MQSLNNILYFRQVGVNLIYNGRPRSLNIAVVKNHVIPEISQRAKHWGRQWGTGQMEEMWWYDDMLCDGGFMNYVYGS